MKNEFPEPGFLFTPRTL